MLTADLANSLNANLLRRWVAAEEQAQGASPIGTLSAPATELEVEKRSFIPLQVERYVGRNGQQISIELRRGATLVKVGWPVAATAECAAWLRELLR